MIIKIHGLKLKKLITSFFCKIINMPISAKSGIVYTFSTLFSKGLLFLTIPIFTRIMSPSQIGIINIYNSWFSLVYTLSTLSLTSGGYQLSLKEFSKENNRYQSSILFLTNIITLIVALIYIINKEYWNNFLELPNKMISMLFIGLLVMPAYDFWMAKQRFDYKYKIASIITILSTLSAVGISVLAVLHSDPNETGWIRLLSNNIIIYGIAGLLGIYIYLNGNTFYNKKYWMFSLSLSIPLVGHAIAKQILDVSDRIMIARMVDMEAVGIYSTLHSVSAVSLIAWNSINGAFVPYLFKNIDNSNEYTNIKKMSSILLLLYTVLAFLIILMAPEIVRVMATNEYTQAVYIMPPIAMGISLTAVSNLYSNLLIYYKRTKVIMFASVTSAVLNITLNYISIPIYGYKAAAYTTLASYIVMALLEAYVATSIYNEINPNKAMIYDNRLFFFLCLSTLLLSLFSIWLYNFHYIRYFIALLCIIIIIYLYAKRKNHD